MLPKHGEDSVGQGYSGFFLQWRIRRLIWTLLEGQSEPTKGQLTTRIRQATNYIAIANSRSPPSQFALEDLRKGTDDINKVHDKLIGLFSILIEHADSEQEVCKLEKELAVEEQRAVETLDKLAQATLLGLPAQAQTHQAAPAAHQAKIRPNDSLKPFTLLTSHTPVQLRNWIRKYRTYYSSSNMHMADIKEQQAYFMDCLGSYLETRIQTKIRDTTPIFRDGDEGAEVSCMELLEDAFIVIHPILTRQFSFFQSSQQPGQLFSDWAASLTAIGDEADLPSLTTDGLYVLRYICGTIDKKLRDKFLKVQKPTLEKFNKIVSIYEAVETSTRVISSQLECSHASRVPDGGDERCAAVSKRPSLRDLDRQGRCWRCGNPGCDPDNCWARSKVCNDCGIKGHLQRVCQSKNSKKRTKVKAKQVSEVIDLAKGGDESSDDGSESENQDEKVKTITIRSTATKENDCTLNNLGPLMKIRIISNNQSSFEFNAVADTGTGRTIIADDVARRFGLPLLKTKTKLAAANGSPMPCSGRCAVTIFFMDKSTDTMALVTSALKNEILVGLDDLKRLSVVKDDFPCVTEIARHVDVDSTDAILKEFADVFSDKLKDEPMAGSPMHIYLRENSVPTRTLTARQYPIHMAAAANEAAEELQKTVLKEVKEPTDWISPGFFVLKGDPMEKKAMKEGLTLITVKDLRLVVDYTNLNKWVQRPVHTFPTSKDIMDRIPAGSKYFCKMDCVQGYHQIELDSESSKLTTFLLPNGRFRFTRTPMGLNASSDEWCRRSDEAIRGVNGAQKIVDDIIVVGCTWSELFARVRQVLKNCRELKITISKRKLSIGQTVKFAGHIVNQEGVRPDPDLVKALTNFPTPKDRTALRRFLGMANQLGSFVPDLAHMSNNLRPLTSTTKAFLWLDDHEREFQRMKGILASDMVVKFFDCDLPTELLTDASRNHGLGFALIQKDNGRICLITCGSRSLTSAETRYATIELECLAIQWAMKKCKQFLLGMSGFTVITDHRPLVGVFNKAIDEATNPRILAMREKMSSYSFNVEWVEGKNHVIADALSRAPLFSPPETDLSLSNSVVCRAIASDPLLQQMFDAAERDPSYRDVVNAFKSGISKKGMPLSHPARPYLNVWDTISLYEETLLVLDGLRIIVPSTFRANVLSKLHLPHAGVTRTRQAALNSYYWPGMCSDIKNLVDSCEKCQEIRPSLPYEPIVPTTASHPMEQVGVDLFQVGNKHYLVMIDRFSGFPFVKQLQSLTSTAIINKIKGIFLEHGYAKKVRSDQGPQFRAEFGQFCKEHGIIHETSSPYNPRSNGLAEAAVKNCKYLMLKCHSFEAFQEALLEFRNTPRATNGLSPAQMFIGRMQRTALPRLLQKTDETIKAENQDGVERGGVFNVGETVRVQDPKSGRWRIKGTIISISKTGRSYTIKTEDGAVIERNRRFTKRFKDLTVK